MKVVYSELNLQASINSSMMEHFVAIVDEGNVDSSIYVGGLVARITYYFYLPLTEGNDPDSFLTIYHLKSLRFLKRKPDKYKWKLK